MWRNDRRLDRFAEPLFNYPLPPDTVVLSRHAKVHKPGTGNHCDYEVVQKMESSLSREEIIDYYQDASFPRIRSSINWGPAAHLILFDDSLPNHDTLKFAYVLFEQNQLAGLDVRCN